MSLDRLIEELDARAETMARTLVEQARAEAAAVREQSRRERTAAIDARLAEVARADRHGAALREAEAVRAARAESLTNRDAFLARVRAALEDLLPAVATGPVARAALPRLLDEALACAGADASLIRCDPALEDALRPLAEARGLRVLADPAAATGFRVESERVAVEQTLRARLRQQWPELRQWIVAEAS